MIFGHEASADGENRWVFPEDIRRHYWSDRRNRPPDQPAALNAAVETPQARAVKESADWKKFKRDAGRSAQVQVQKAALPLVLWVRKSADIADHSRAPLHHSSMPMDVMGQNR
jgi:hypothetical protein